MSNPAFWPDKTIKSQDNHFSWVSSPPAQTLKAMQAERTRELAAAYSRTDAGRAVHAKAWAKGKAKRKAGLTPIPSSAVLKHDTKPKTGRAGQGFRTI